MKNMKKVLAMVLALTMILSVGAITSLAYSDVEETSTVGEAVSILSNLGIFEGFEDGTFRPDDTVTRAQMAAVICRMLGYEDQAKSSGGATVFYDVPAEHWAAGYVNLAQQLGVINGFGDGTFRPEEKVTYEQAVKMIVCALGYDLAAQSKGGYPTGYLSIASSEGITKNSKGSVGEPAKRSTIAMLTYNSLEVRLFDQTSWTTNGSDEYKKTDDTVLSKYLEVQRWEGIVTSVPFTDYADDGFSKSNAPYITVDGFYKKYNNGSESKYYDDSPKRADCSLVNAGDLLGKKVIAYIGDSEDDDTGRYMVYAISEKTNANNTTAIAGTQLVDDQDKEWTKKGQISYRKTGSTKVYDLDLSDNVQFYVNYSYYGSLDEDASTKDVAGLIEEGGRLRLISNNNDNEIEYVLINAYDAEAVIEDVTEDDGIYAFDLYCGELDEIDTEDDDALTVIYKDGAVISPKDLEEGDTVSTVEIDGSDVRILYVSSETVTGTVSGYDSDENTVYISGSDYEISPFLGKQAKSLKDEEGTFYLNVDGQIAHNESDSAAAGNYGIVLAVDYSGGISSGYVVQAAFADGTIAEYDLSSKVKLYDKNGNISASDDDNVASALAAMADNSKSLNNQAVFTTVANVKNMMFKFTVKNGDITKIKTPTGDTYSNYLNANSKKYDADSMSYGSVEFDDDTVVFSIDCAYSSSSTAKVDKDDISIGRVSRFFADGEDGYTLIAIDEKNGTYGAVIGFALSASVPENGDAVIISGVRTVTYDSDDAVQITGLRGGKEVTYIIYDENSRYAWNDVPEDLSKGDVILVSSADSDGVVSDFKLLYKASKNGMGRVTAGALAGNPSDDVYNAAGALKKDKTTNSKFYIDTDVTNSGSNIFAEEEDGISMKSSANYTLVDYSESTKNPEISKKSPGTSLFSTSSRYDSYVFVRVYDDVLSDVVVYRFASDDETVQKLAAPTFTLQGEDTKTLVIEAESGAEIHYTTDKATPSKSSAEYTAPISLTSPVTVKAIAVRSGYDSSSVSTYEYTVQLPAPTITFSDGTVSIAPIENAKIYYTDDGTNPSPASELYSAPIALTESKTIKAIAVSEIGGYTNSEISEKECSIPRLESPVISISDGYASISSANDSAVIYYTTDGTTPTTASSVYSGTAIPLSGAVTVKAIAYKDGYASSNVETKVYNPQVKTPKITITGTSAQIECATDGAVIYYTTDGTEPSSASQQYSSAIELTGAAVIKAIAIKPGFENSYIEEKTYTPKVKTPKITITGASVQIECATDGAAIYYTTDGKEPSADSLKYDKAITLTESATVKAIAVKEGFEDSEAAVKTYTAAVKTPKITVKDAAAEITCSTDGAVIYYTTDGKAPTKASLKYDKAIALSGAVTIKAIAVKDGFDDSEVATEKYTPQVKTPKIAIKGTAAEITCSTDGAVIYYTTDGKAPTKASLKYDKAIALSGAVTIKAIAVKDGFEDSEVATEKYTPQVKTPSITINGATAEISCATSGAEIYYTTDGKEPTKSSTKYIKPFLLSGTGVLKAIAVGTGYEDSEIVSKQYSIASKTEESEKAETK